MMELRKIEKRKTKRLFGMNKKGQVESAILSVVLIFIIGILIFFSSHVNDTLYTSLDDYFNSSPEYNDSEARHVIQKIRQAERSSWDFAFLAVMVLVVVVMLLLSFATRINIAFFWVFVILGLVVLAAAVILSNMWQEIAANPEFTDTVARFPIMNLALGNFFPTIAIGILFLIMIVLFGKPPTEGLTG